MLDYEPHVSLGSGEYSHRRICLSLLVWPSPHNESSVQTSPQQSEDRKMKYNFNLMLISLTHINTSKFIKIYSKCLLKTTCQPNSCPTTSKAVLY